jgi:transcriptional regulator with XRE-family HTH domain
MNATEAKINRLIGARMREARLANGVSLQKMGRVLDISYQAIQKYEKGGTVIPVGRLVMMARFLGLELDYFFQKTNGESHDTHGSRYRRVLLMRKLQRIERSDPVKFRAICEMIGPTINSPQT